jgi:MraZ protein
MIRLFLDNMFRGATNLSMDAKGRLSVPAKHRDALLTQSAGNVVLTAHPHGCLLLYPQPAWEPIQAKMMALSSFDKQSSSLQRLLVGFAEDITVDAAGRLLISPTLRDFAGLEKDVMLVGQGSHFEMWNLSAWRKQLDNVMSGDGIEMPAELEGFSL